MTGPEETRGQGEKGGAEGTREGVLVRPYLLSPLKNKEEPCERKPI